MTGLFGAGIDGEVLESNSFGTYSVHGVAWASPGRMTDDPDKSSNAVSPPGWNSVQPGGSSRWVVEALRHDFSAEPTAYLQFWEFDCPWGQQTGTPQLRLARTLDAS
ncbi:hypothetical protein GCM10027068_48250 [Prescottella soli]